MNNAPVHFEIPADNVARLSAFYRDLFGWRFNQYPGLDYWHITPAPDDKNALGGGMLPRHGVQRQGLLYIQVESIDRAAEKIQVLGGSILLPKQAFSDAGWFLIFLDPQNNLLGLWENTPPAA